MFIVLLWTWMNTKIISFPLAYVSTGGLIQYLGHQLPAPRSQQGGAGWQCQRKETQRLHWNERSLLNPGRTIFDGWPAKEGGWFPTAWHWLIPYIFIHVSLAGHAGRHITKKKLLQADSTLDGWIIVRKVNRISWSQNLHQVQQSWRYSRHSTFPW